MRYEITGDTWICRRTVSSTSTSPSRSARSGRRTEDGSPLEGGSVATARQGARTWRSFAPNALRFAYDLIVSKTTSPSSPPLIAPYTNARCLAGLIGDDCIAVAGYIPGRACSFDSNTSREQPRHHEATYEDTPTACLLALVEA